MMRENQGHEKAAPLGAIDRTLLSHWLRRIHDHIRPKCPASVEVTRFVNALQFSAHGKLFAILRVDTTGLFLREWNDVGQMSDVRDLNMIDARTFLERLLQRRLAAA